MNLLRVYAAKQANACKDPHGAINLAQSVRREQGPIVPWSGYNQKYANRIELISVAFFAIAISLAANFSACGADLEGQASVIDGDTLEIHGTRIRIFGIDAPESDQLCRNEESEFYRCGQKASNALFDFIARRPVECIEVDRDRYGRAVSVCTVAGIDLAGWMVGNGHALDWPKYSKGNYAAAQVVAILTRSVPD